MESAQPCNTPAGEAGGDPRWSTRWLDVPRGNHTAEEVHLDSTEDSQGTNAWVSLPMFFHKYFFPSFVLLSDWVFCCSGLRLTMQLKMVRNFQPSSFHLLSVRVTVYLVLGVRFYTCQPSSLQADDCPETLYVPLVLLVSPTFPGYHSGLGMFH